MFAWSIRPQAWCSERLCSSGLSHWPYAYSVANRPPRYSRSSRRRRLPLASSAGFSGLFSHQRPLLVRQRAVRRPMPVRGVRKGGLMIRTAVSFPFWVAAGARPLTPPSPPWGEGRVRGVVPPFRTTVLAPGNPAGFVFRPGAPGFSQLQSGSPPVPSMASRLHTFRDRPGHVQ